MTTKQLYTALDARIPRDLSAAWDNDGLSCLPEDRTASRVLVALDATEAVVNYAIAGNFDALLTHHPLLFRGVKALTHEQTEKIRIKLGKMTGKTVNIKCKIEKELLGGIRLAFMGRQLDGSLRARLASIEDGLKNTIL